jgi:polyisoprenoid-binding protein YceI
MKLFAVLVLAGILAPAALAQHQTFVVNPDASEVKMALNTNHEVVDGTFHVQSGSIDFDRGTSKMSGSVVVLAGSGKTGNDSRDKKMNKDILKVEQYATASFEPKTYSGALAASGDSNLQVTGIFTLLGTPHEITVPMVVHLEGDRATAKAHFVVPYVQWGLKNPSFLIWKAENDVAIDLNLVGAISK